MSFQVTGTRCSIGAAAQAAPAALAAPLVGLDGSNCLSRLTVSGGAILFGLNAGGGNVTEDPSHFRYDSTRNNLYVGDTTSGNATNGLTIGANCVNNATDGSLLGGTGNTLNGTRGMIGGGQNNTVTPAFASILMGSGNTIGIDAEYSIIGSAQDSQIQFNSPQASHHSAILSGFTCIVSRPYGLIGNGYLNEANAFLATVVNGVGLGANANCQVVIGTYNARQGTNLNVLGYGQVNDHAFILGNGINSLSRSNAFALRFDGVVQFYPNQTVPSALDASQAITALTASLGTTSGTNIYPGCCTLVLLTSTGAYSLFFFDGLVWKQWI